MVLFQNDKIETSNNTITMEETSEQEVRNNKNNNDDNDDRENAENEDFNSINDNENDDGYERDKQNDTLKSTVNKINPAFKQKLEKISNLIDKMNKEKNKRQNYIFELCNATLQDNKFKTIVQKEKHNKTNLNSILSQTDIQQKEHKINNYRDTIDIMYHCLDIHNNEKSEEQVRELLSEQYRNIDDESDEIESDNNTNNRSDNKKEKIFDAKKDAEDFEKIILFPILIWKQRLFGPE